MRIVLKILGWTLGILIGLPLVLILLVIVLLNTGFGRGQVEHLTGQLTGGQVVIAGLSGRFPDSLRLAHAELRDTQGTWLTLDGVALNWSPTRLLAREALVDLLLADRIQVLRLPVAAPKPATPAPADDTPFSLPVRVSVETLRVARAEIGAPIAGTAAVLALAGSAHLVSLQDGDVDAAIDRLDSPGSYQVRGRIDPARIAARLRLNEPAGGLISTIAKLPDLGAIALQADVDGPRTAEATTLSLTAGPLAANAKGTLDLVAYGADMDVTANAPAMTPAPGVSWQTVALDAHVHGPFTKPDASGTLTMTGLQAAGVAFANLSAQIQGNQGAAGLHASITGLRIPGPKPDLLAAAPVILQADARLDDAKRPVTFTLAHPLIQAAGGADTGGDITAHADITLPDLAPLAAIGAVDLAGHAQLAVKAAMAGGTTKLDVDGTVGVTGGQAPIPALIGDAKLGVSVALAGSDITVSRAQVDGRTINLAASGTDKAGVLDLAYRLGLTNLAVLTPTVEGAVALQGTAKGPMDAIAVDVDAKGDIGAKGIPRGPVTLAVHATGLPAHPAGSVVAQGMLEGAPLDLAVQAVRTEDGTLNATIQRADWRSLHAEGALTLPPNTTLPRGKVSLRMTKLDDLRPFIGQPIGGGISADIVLDAAAVNLALDATRISVAANGAGRVKLAARIADPLGRRVVDATLDADGIAASGITGSAKLTAKGPQDALALRLNAALQNLAGADATIATAATLNVPGKNVQLASLSTVWKGQDIHLLAPARISFADGVSVDRLRIGLQQAVLDIAGRATPALNLTASLRGVTPDLAKPFAPDVDATGQISADAKLTGTPAAPQGTIRLTAAGVRMRTGPGRALPEANLTATAQLAGQSAAIDAKMTVGRSNLAVTGRAPLGAGALALHAVGGIDLAVLDPILLADGRRVRGRVALDASIAGTAAVPLVNGAVTLAGGEVQDFTQGVHLTDLAATLRADGDTVRIASLTGHAGAGTITASGSVGLKGPMPVNITLAMRNARLLESDRLTADLNADLALRGDLETALAASGSIAILRASINIPEHLPTSIAVLNVRVAGQKPPPPPKPSATIRLDLTLTTPGQIFVRGRGLDAVMGGGLHVGGTTTTPQISGGFQMTRGTFSLAGTTLTFTRGKVGFDGAGATDKIDPSLDFEADVVTTNVTAMLLVGGYASAPKITLSSTPVLPQDEVLAQLLFGRSAKELGPFQYAEIVAALADLSGTTNVGNPLDRVRKGLGLDRLNVTSGSGTTSTKTSSSAATIEAGRYIANGVYVGAKQGTVGSQTQATVEIDIIKGLKAVTDVGTGSGGNSVGLKYQFDY